VRVSCRVSCVLCPVSCVLCPVSRVARRVSCVVCRVSCVVCHVSCVVRIQIYRSKAPYHLLPPWPYPRAFSAAPSPRGSTRGRCLKVQTVSSRLDLESDVQNHGCCAHQFERQTEGTNMRKPRGRPGCRVQVVDFRGFGFLGDVVGSMHGQGSRVDCEFHLRRFASDCCRVRPPRLSAGLVLSSPSPPTP
jgi:hypothetical protein